MQKHNKVINIFFALILSLLISTGGAEAYADLAAEIAAAPGSASTTIIVPNDVIMSNTDTAIVIDSSKNITLKTDNGLAMELDSESEDPFFTVRNGATLNIEGPITMQNGGMALNNSGSVNIVSDGLISFENHTSSNGAAVSNAGTINIDGGVINFTDNKVQNGGGAIYNGPTGIITIGSSGSVVNFTNNKTTGSTSGGAIVNSGTLSIDGSIITFSDNTAILGGGGIVAYNANSTIGSADSIVRFINNHSETSGAAIALSEGTMTVNGRGEFTGNTSSTHLGGAIAIYGGIFNLNATSGDFVFSGNTNFGVSNAIHNQWGTLNLNAFSAHQIIFNDRITGNEGSAININYDSSAAGTIVFNEDMQGFKGTLNVNGGTLKLGSAGILPATGTAFNMYSNSTLDLLNDKIDTLAISNFNLLGKAFVKLDVDLETETADNFIGTTLQSGTGPLAINKLLLWSDMLDQSAIVEILIADDAALKDALSLDGSQKTVYGPLYAYNAAYKVKDDGGYLVFGSLDLDSPIEFNPAVFIPQVSAQTGGYMAQLNANAQGFEILENNYETECPGCGLWVRPYGYKEDVDFKNGPKMNNTAWGAFAGYDTKPVDIGGGFENNFSFYAGYNNNAPRYEDVRIEQDGILAGITAAFYKERFFGGITVNAGTTRNKAVSLHGKEEFNMFTAGAAVKAGYKIPLNAAESLTLQPIMNAAYSLISVENYTNAAGLEMASKNLTPLTLAPELKLQTDLSNRWSLYAGGSYVHSFMDDKASFSADDVNLPQISVKPYVQYGAGLSKGITEHLKVGLEGYGRSLGREGYGGQLTLRWNFGKCAKEEPVIAPAPAKEAEVIDEPRLELGKSVKISGEFFVTDSYHVSLEFEDYLKRKVKELKDISYNNVEIAGHTDSTGSASYNQHLSEQRAKAIADLFIAEGIPSEKVSYIGKGAAEPAASNHTRYGRAVNRRVEISVN